MAGNEGYQYRIAGSITSGSGTALTKTPVQCRDFSRNLDAPSSQPLLKVFEDMGKYSFVID